MSKSQEEKQLKLLQETLDALMDIIVIVNVSDFFKIEETDTPGLLVSEGIRIGENYLILPGSLYILGEEPPYNIYSTGFSKEKGNGYISIEPTQIYDDNNEPLTLYSLINYIYKYYELNEEQRGIIERNFIKGIVEPNKDKAKRNEALTVEPLKLKNVINIMNDKLTNVIPAKEPSFTEDESGQIAFTWLIDPKARQESQIGLTLVMPDNFITTRPIDGYDIRVIEAVSELVDDGRTSFTLRQLYKQMTDTEDPGAPQLAELEESVEKLRTTIGKLDLTKGNDNIEISWNGKTLKLTTIDDNLLPLRGVELLAPNGKKVKGYLITGDILLIQYNKGVNKNGRLLHAPRVPIGGVSKNREYVIIKRYLDQRLLNMSTGALNNNVINYNTLCVDSGIGRPEDRIIRQENQTEKAFNSQIRKRRANDRKIIEAILEGYKKESHIKEWEPIMQSGKFKGYHIKFYKN